jgi:L-threonylcarbamoyladenylate synthase
LTKSIPTRAASEALEKCIRRGGVAVFPTDTVYGLCCDPLNGAAVTRLYELKGRAPDKPAAILCFSLEVALTAVPDCGARTLAALQRLLPGAVTVLLANPTRRFPLAGGELLGLRVIDIGIALSRPVLQSSANLAGGSEAKALGEVPRTIRAGADLVIDGGQLPGRPSSVVDLSEFEAGGSWRLLRAGALDREAIEQALAD